MTSVVAGSDRLFLCSNQEIVDLLLGNIMSNKKRYVGTEWETFFITPEGHPITRLDGQRAFVEFKNVFALMGYKTAYLHEKNKSNTRKTVGLEIEGLGSIFTEAGHQFEFACSVCHDCNEIEEKNATASAAIHEVAKRLNYVPVFQGHLPKYAENSEGMDRSRSRQWTRYYTRRFGKDATLVREAQNGTASIQVTLDSGAEKFHEFFQAALLIEPALALHYANSARSYIGINLYGHAIPSQVQPILDVWQTKNPEQALNAIVNRLMEIEVPFLPHPNYPDLCKAEPFTKGRPPTVRNLMEAGRLNEKTLNNISGFFYTRPALRNFSQGLIEIRGIDSQSTSGKVTEIARRVTALIYNDTAREALLKDYAHLKATDLQTMHNASVMLDRNEALNVKIACISMNDFIEDILSRSQEKEPKKILPSLFASTSTYQRPRRNGSIALTAS